MRPQHIHCYFNPRSLAGATDGHYYHLSIFTISIHAPLRERHLLFLAVCNSKKFQSTLPCGSDCKVYCHRSFLVHFNPRSLAGATVGRSLHTTVLLFQSTLPCGSDVSVLPKPWASFFYFNPRSLAGATHSCCFDSYPLPISIHAPLRERHRRCDNFLHQQYFNPRSLAGATNAFVIHSSHSSDFNPRSLAGATYRFCQ